MKNNIKNMVANLIINALCQMSLEDFLILDGAVDRIVLNSMKPATKNSCCHSDMDGYRKLLNDIIAPETEEECDEHDAAMEELDEIRIELENRECALDEREDGLNKREAELDERECALDDRENELDQRNSALNIREENLDEREAELDAIENEEPQTDNIFRDIDYGKVKGLVTNILGMLGGRE